MQILLAYLVMSIVTLEVIDEGVNVLILLLLDGHLGVVLGLLVKFSALDIGRQRRSAGRRGLRHGR